MKDNGKIICIMEWDYLSGQMERATEGSTRTIRKVEKVSCLGLMENAKQEYGAMDSLYKNKLIELPIIIMGLTHINHY